MQSDNAFSQQGFSLIELLVVVAIIGTLAAAGIIGYQNYTENAKRAVVEASLADWSRRVPTDQFGAGDDTFSSDNELVNNTDGLNACVQYVDRLVTVANEQNNNPFYPDDEEPYFNGHRPPFALSGATAEGWGSPGTANYSSSPPTSPPFKPTWFGPGGIAPSAAIAIPPGKTLVFCTRGENPVSQGNALNLCACLNPAGCNSRAVSSPSAEGYCGPEPTWWTSAAYPIGEL